ncbi:hypothetical protein GGR51DRAFT_192971 [Nemania sp. FL0031]|nr:hypothetical protein GGR51DRAFT_192971 [Nemania sp. FL0031]
MEILEYQLGTIPELEVAITEVFSSVLGLCGICVEYIRKKRFGKVIQALATGPDATLKNAQEAFHQKVQKVRNIVNNATLSRVIGLRDDTSILQADISRGLVISERINTNVNSFLQNTGQLLDKIERRETATERNEVLEWLSKINFHDKQRAIFDKHHKSTGEWLLNSDIFQAWFSDGVNLPLWCPGIPGAGKTVMLSRAVTYIEENTDRSRVAVSYVYCDYKEPRTEIDMLSIIMRQLAEQCHPLPKEVVLFREKYLEKRTYPSNDDRISVIKAMARIFDKTFIFIDALDECLEQHRENFLGLAKELSGCVRFFITSRPHLDLTPTFPTLLRLDIMADESDVRAYLNHRITTHNRLSRLIKQSPKLKDEIVDTVYRKAEGSYWLIFKSLISKVNITLETHESLLRTYLRASMHFIVKHSIESRDRKMATRSWRLKPFPSYTVLRGH